MHRAWDSDMACQVDLLARWEYLSCLSHASEPGRIPLQEVDGWGHAVGPTFCRLP